VHGIVWFLRPPEEAGSATAATAAGGAMLRSSMARTERSRQVWPGSSGSAFEEMSNSDRRGAMSKVASRLVADCSAGHIAEPFHCPRSVSLPSLGRTTKSIRSLADSSPLRQERRDSSLFGGTQGITAEALREEFSMVDSMIEHLKHRSRVPEIDPGSPGRQADVFKGLAASRTPQRRDKEVEEEEQAFMRTTVVKVQKETRDARINVQRKLAHRREVAAEGATGEFYANCRRLFRSFCLSCRTCMGHSPPTRERSLPMLHLHVQRAGGTERVDLVDVSALKSRSKFSAGPRASVESLLEARRSAEKQLRFAATSAIHRGNASSQDSVLGALSWEERYYMVAERKQQQAVANYLHKMNSRREKAAPLPVAEQFHEDPDF